MTLLSSLRLATDVDSLRVGAAIVATRPQCYSVLLDRGLDVVDAASATSSPGLARR